MMESYIVKIIDDQNKKEITLPMTPNELSLSGSTVEKGFDTIVSGDKPRPKGRSAYQYPLSGLIPDEGFDIPMYSDITPFEFEELLRDWQESRQPYNKKLRLIVSETTINEMVYLNNFSIDYSGGGRMIRYTVEFTEWRDFDIKVYDATKTSTEQKKRPTTPLAKTYVVKKNDSLSKIARSYTGKVADWTELYNLNKSTLKSKDPNLIYPGEKLVIPSGWLK